ncbi:MAG: MoaD/ThiS family protein [Candidatus Hydrogenedentes bacterium]|nr:MoaD/ThiS family protein [Candidatus Hydrogenedentota bacterium]
MKEHGRTVHVHYYALLREQSGISDETVHTEAETVLDLFVELNERYHFAARPERLKVALNAEFRNWDDKISHGDTIVFLPPVAGG